MSQDINIRLTGSRLAYPCCVALVWTCLLVVLNPTGARAQDESLPIGGAEIEAIMTEGSDPAGETPTAPSGIDLLTLILRGGAFMIPIGLTSLLVVALAFERSLAMRRSKIIPRPLVEELESLSVSLHSFDPGEAYLACEDRNCPAARVVKSMLMRTGQPIADIERAASESLEREADHYASPIRWLTLAAAATPLMGLLGTVWGMIVAFHESTTLTADRSRSEQLSEGIYTALVTTLAGLAVAIPAAVMALYLENRLAKLFHHVEQFAFDLAPAIGQFEGKKRLDAEGHVHSLGEVPTQVTEGSPAAEKKKRNGAKAG